MLLTITLLSFGIWGQHHGCRDNPGVGSPGCIQRVITTHVTPVFIRRVPPTLPPTAPNVLNFSLPTCSNSHILPCMSDTNISLGPSGLDSFNDATSAINPIELCLNNYNRYESVVPGHCPGNISSITITPQRQQAQAKVMECCLFNIGLKIKFIIYIYIYIK